MLHHTRPVLKPDTVGKGPQGPFTCPPLKLRARLVLAEQGSRGLPSFLGLWAGENGEPGEESDGWLMKRVAPCPV